MEIDGHYTFRTLLVVYSNFSTLRKYVLLQKKKTEVPPTVGGTSVFFSSEESDFL